MPPTRRTPSINVSLPALYGKIERIEPAVGAALVRSDGRASVSGHHHHERRHHAAVARLSHQDPRRQPSARVRASHQRVADHGGRALPGHTLVVLDPQLMLVIDAFPCEDGHV